MSKNETFSLFKKDNGIYKIISFLPITNTQNSVIAYLVSYTDSTKLTTMINDFYHVNIIIILSLLIVAFFVYRVVLYNHELRLEKKKFYNLSQYDTLTQLPNRTLFYDRLEESISKATQNKTRFALLLIDIDNFKHLNDSYGHSEGDKILKSVGLKLKKIIPQEDTLARIGGDEFVVIIENINNSLDVNATTNKIINLFKIPINIENKLHYISVSIGISLFDDDSNEISELIKYADIAMYKAKDAGKNNAQFYSPEMTQEVVERVTLENELREAIKNEEFIVHYQPQVNGLNSKLIGMEALVRWQHPTKGLISPIKFIPIAEESGLIIPLDQLVMKIAMKQMSEWYKKGLNPGKLAINLAIKQLQQKNFIEILKDIMSETDCKREWLELEVTEGQIMTNPEQAIKVLNQISDLGIELAIDDFGTGYSSLSYLKKLPINKLKIDQSFVKDLPKDEDDAAIVKAVIALGHSLNLRLIAEGVETKEQKDFLIKNGCNNIQGYFYSKPINAQEMETTLLKEVVSLQK
ncbi:MAG: EAL domain-containing protein [Helicobacteraceae bacterium]|nr:EAL domain-containing protein [Helicobacteraceae bacterium]